VFDAWDTLDEEQQRELLSDCETFDPREVNTLFKDLVKGVDKNKSDYVTSVIQPYESNICKKESLSETEKAEY
jgi:transcription termination factor NusB